ncbi:MAG: hypothetical protein ACP5JV_08960 [Thermus sp.]|uniref:hypothetical protein n=1 Tax=Thermus sp. TaxID=275 RepID=UPI003D0E94DB
MGYRRFRVDRVEVEARATPGAQPQGGEAPRGAAQIRPSARNIRAAWFAAPPRPLPPEVMRRVGAVLEIHGLQGAWNMAGNRLPPEELARLLEALGEGEPPLPA